MKQIQYSILTIALMFLMSCKKNDNTVVTTSSSWSFKGVNYNASSCSMNSWELFGSSNSPMGGLTIYFASNPTSGNYVVNGGGPTVMGQVAISLRNSSNSYGSVGGQNQTISVSVGSNNKVTASGNNIKMVDGFNTSDTSLLNFSITQQ